MASVSITQKNFAPRPFKEKEVIGAVLAELQNRQKPKMVKLGERTIATWNDPPRMGGAFRFSGGYTSLQLTLDGTHKEVWKWLWLNYGTSVRYAVMSNPYYAKTYPGFLGSVSGKGDVVGFNWNSKKGIEARGWDKLMSDIMAMTYSSDIQAAIDRGWASAIAKGKVT